MQTRTGKAPKPDYDAIVIGAGISGMYQLYRLRELGMRVRVFEAGTGVGGTWYWNRYPGARFDSESYSYAYSFSPELLEEWSWSEHFAAQPETLRYLNHVADKFDLRRDIQFRARVAAAHYRDDARTWDVTLEDGSRHTARFLITAIGPLSAPTMPRVEGVDTFKGQSFHTAQVATRAGKFCRQARRRDRHRRYRRADDRGGRQDRRASRPCFSARRTGASPCTTARSIRRPRQRSRPDYPEMFKRCQETYACFIHTPDPRGTFEVTPQEREAFLEKLYATPGFAMWQGNFRDMLTDREANAIVSEFVARKIRERVKDQKVAEKLIPKDHGFGTRRVPMETQILRGLQPAERETRRHQGDADRAHHA